jgi:hypothetical protein
MKGWISLGALLLAAWLVLWLGLKLVSGAVHLLLLLAIAAFIWGLISRSRTRGRL